MNCLVVELFANVKSFGFYTKIVSKQSQYVKMYLLKNIRISNQGEKNQIPLCIVLSLVKLCFKFM